MANEGGTWIMHGLAWDDPERIKTYRELIQWINEVGFVPLFKNEIDGFSVEEHVSPDYWWTGDKENDPWEWREIVARTNEVAYGKFFGRKSGFISLEWLPVFANYRRDGYDFDARWDDGLAGIRSKKIMDCFEEEAEAEIVEYTGYQLKQKIGFGKNGYKNFDGVMAELQMQMYLTIKDFRCKRNKKGQAYGMPVSVYARPEDLWGYRTVTGAYDEEPEHSRQKIFEHVKKLYPGVSERALRGIL